MIIEVLENEKRRIEKLIKIIETNAEDAPKGSLRVSESSKRSKTFRYSINGSERCLTDEDSGFLKALVQRDYEKRIEREARYELENIEMFLKHYNEKGFEEIYEKMGRERKKLVVPFEVGKETFVKEWSSKEYVGNPMEKGAYSFKTDNGEIVRSKSELIIANKLFKANVPYRYEYPWNSKGSKTLYPDFTILQVETRKELIWEHFGMMDNPEYRSSAFKKIEFYASHGWFIGMNLIVTFEESNRPVNIWYVDEIIRQVLVGEKGKILR